MAGRLYRIELSRRAERALLAPPAEAAARIEPKIDALARNPHPPGAQKLAGADDIYRLRVGDYRVLYQVRARVLLVLVVDVAHGRDVYRR